MRIIVAFTFLFIFHSGLTQDYSKRLEFTVQYYPTKTSVYEFYQLGFYHNLSDRFALGGSINSILGHSKEQDFSFSNTYVSFGAKWYLFPNRRFFIDPMIDAQYVATELRPTARLFRGFGIKGAVNIGYEFNRFGIGITGQSGIALGKRSVVGGGNVSGGVLIPDGITYQFDLLNAGVYFSYKF